MKSFTEFINEGFSGLGSWLSSDNAADVASKIGDAITEILREEINKEANEYNTPGIINVALVLEDLAPTDIAKSAIDDEFITKVIQGLEKLKEEYSSHDDGYGDTKNQMLSDIERLIGSMNSMLM